MPRPTPDFTDKCMVDKATPNVRNVVARLEPLSSREPWTCTSQQPDWLMYTHEITRGLNSHADGTLETLYRSYFKDLAIERGLSERQLSSAVTLQMPRRGWRLQDFLRLP